MSAKSFSSEFLRRSIILKAMVLILFMGQLCFGQNALKLQEEDLKEQERLSKYQEYLKQREQEKKALLDKPLSREEITNRNLVEVEPNNVLPSDLAKTYSLVPYKVRRGGWGQLVSVSYGLFEPSNYLSDYDIGGLSKDDLYGSAETPLIELSYLYKWNFIGGSIGAEIGAGIYSNDAKESELGDAKLGLQIYRIGLRYSADNLFLDPIVVPYAGVGAYTVFFRETQGNATFNGNTEISYYYVFGGLFQLGWLDPKAAVESYTENGIENTFLFAEARQYFASNNENDPDFSTDLTYNFGISVEF